VSSSVLQANVGVGSDTRVQHYCPLARGIHRPRAAYKLQHTITTDYHYYCFSYCCYYYFRVSFNRSIVQEITTGTGDQ